MTEQKLLNFLGNRKKERMGIALCLILALFTYMPSNHQADNWQFAYITLLALAILGMIRYAVMAYLAKKRIKYLSYEARTIDSDCNNASFVPRYSRLRYPSLEEYLKLYIRLFLREPLIMLKIKGYIGFWILSFLVYTESPNDAVVGYLIETLFHPEMETYRESHKFLREQEKQQILHGMVSEQDKKCSATNDDSPSLPAIYGIEETLWESSEHPIIKNLKNSRYLHHEDPDIIRALETIVIDERYSPK